MKQTKPRKYQETKWEDVEPVLKDLGFEDQLFLNKRIRYYSIYRYSKNRIDLIIDLDCASWYKVTYNKFECQTEYPIKAIKQIIEKDFEEKFDDWLI